MAVTQNRCLEVASRWISTMLFSAANVFYGLTPNGFKAWKNGTPVVSS